MELKFFKIDFMNEDDPDEEKKKPDPHVRYRLTKSRSFEYYKLQYIINCNILCSAK